MSDGAPPRQVKVHTRLAPLSPAEEEVLGEGYVVFETQPLQMAAQPKQPDGAVPLVLVCVLPPYTRGQVSKLAAPHGDLERVQRAFHPNHAPTVRMFLKKSELTKEIVDEFDRVMAVQAVAAVQPDPEA